MFILVNFIFFFLNPKLYSGKFDRSICVYRIITAGWALTLDLFSAEKICFLPLFVRIEFYQLYFHFTID